MACGIVNARKFDFQLVDVRLLRERANRPRPEIDLHIRRICWAARILLIQLVILHLFSIPDERCNAWQVQFSRQLLLFNDLLLFDS